MKMRVYVESSILSYLTARPSTELLTLVRQQLTYVFWERRKTWDLIVTPPVMDEITLGDPGAAAQRVLASKECKLLPFLPEAERLANLLIKKKAVPETSYDDALHLSLAAAYRIPYLLTWNQKHLDNTTLRSKIEKTIKEEGLQPASVLSPDRFLEEMDED